MGLPGPAPSGRDATIDEFVLMACQARHSVPCFRAVPQPLPMIRDASPTERMLLAALATDSASESYDDFVDPFAEPMCGICCMPRFSYCTCMTTDEASGSDLRAQAGEPCAGTALSPPACLGSVPRAPGHVKVPAPPPATSSSTPGRLPRGPTLAASRSPSSLLARSPSTDASVD